MIKKIFFLVCFLVLGSILVFAQNNLREGIVITLEGDTLHGSLEYRTDKINAERCTFIQDGTNDYRIYKPGEIKGYRFLDNGRYYVSMMVKKKEDFTGAVTETMYFVEYVMKGNMSLYHAAACETYILENESGESASFTSKDATQHTSNEERREQLAEAYTLLSPSAKASSLLWRLENNLKNTQKVVQTYNDEVCPDGTCEIFEYKSAKKPMEDRIFFPFVKVGYSVGTVKYYQYEEDKYMHKDVIYKNKVTYASPSITVGCDLHLDRLLKGLMTQVSGSYSHVNSSTSDEDRMRFYQIKCDIYSFKVGPAYQFTFGNFKPYVGAGYNAHLYAQTKYYEKEYIGEPAMLHKLNRKCELCHSGYYATLGLEYPLSKGALIVNADYSKNTYNPINEDFEFGFIAYNFNVGYRF